MEFERRRFQRHIHRTYGYYEFELEHVNFLYRPLTSRQYHDLEYKFHDCIISGRLKNRHTGWFYRVSAYIKLYIYIAILTYACLYNFFLTLI